MIERATRWDNYPICTTGGTNALVKLFSSVVKLCTKTNGGVITTKLTAVDKIDAAIEAKHFTLKTPAKPECCDGYASVST